MAKLKRAKIPSFQYKELYLYVRVRQTFIFCILSFISSISIPVILFIIFFIPYFFIFYSIHTEVMKGVKWKVIDENEKNMNTI